MKAEQKRADADAMRTSAAHAMPRPPPNATPLTAATMTCGVVRMCTVRFDMKAWPSTPTLT
jgi:hypothetical protein